MKMTHAMTLQVNGQTFDVTAPASASLLDVLRDHLSLTGTKGNCLEGECGVCTVHLDGRAVNSCIVLAAQCEGLAITTIEGLGTGENLHPLQKNFVAKGAVQCGYCIPGMVMTAAGYLAENPSPSRAEIAEGLSGTLCRCTGYQKIIDAVEATAAKRA